MANYKQFSVVAVPFPFTDKDRKKKRPALVVSNPASFDKKIGHSVLAMITSAKNSSWPLDVKLQNLKESGLPASSVVRMKFFTLDHKLIEKALGRLSSKDQEGVQRALKSLFFERANRS